MVTNRGGVREVTAPMQFKLVGDRLHFTIVSGECERTFSIGRDLAFHAINEATPLLLEKRRAGNVSPLRRKNPSRSH
jgi:hypothetical protein